MPVFKSIHFANHEQVVFGSDPGTGLKSIIAIHSTARGSALGGCRMWPYGSEEEAVRDALRLSRGMSYKNALADLPLGGGKSVIIGDPRKVKTVALMRSMGEAVERLAGRYIIAEDVGTGVHDMDVIRSRTAHVAGLPDGSGDPSPATAYGVFVAIEEAARLVLARGDLEGMRVGLQGLGHVGRELCRRLADAGARLYVADLYPENVEAAADDFGATPVSPDGIYGLDVDVFAPCAMGGVINDRTLPVLGARIVAGSANNQLAEERHGLELARRGIVWCPDFAINSGGVINISYELDGRYDREAAFEHVARIRHTLREILVFAQQRNIPLNLAANRMAESRLNR